MRSASLLSVGVLSAVAADCSRGAEFASEISCHDDTARR